MTPSPARAPSFAPTGKLRVGINYGNFLLVNKDPAKRRIPRDRGGPGAGDRPAAERPVDLVAFETAGKLADAVKAGAWDVQRRPISAQVHRDPAVFALAGSLFTSRKFP